jgi:hypothetical protein
MTCHEAQANLSFYLYGELDFAAEEALEQHLGGCALCQLALGREKEMHALLNAAQADVPLALLNESRSDLKSALSSARPARSIHLWPRSFHFAGLAPTRWSAQVAAASFLLFIGFSAGRFIDRTGISLSEPGSVAMSLIGPATSRIRDIQPVDSGHVRIIIDRVQQGEISGSVDSQNVRRWLLTAMQDPDDPGLRVDSVEMLKGQGGEDVRNALLASVRHDPNAAVRLKALEGLRNFDSDPAVRETLAYVLQHDINAGVRAEAIDVLAPANRVPDLNPQVVQALQQVLQSQTDSYLRLRCLELLGSAGAIGNVY